MRVTNQMLNYMSLNGVTSVTNKMLSIIEQGNSGLRINRPSDGPISYSIARRYDKQIQQNERYLENNAVATAWLQRQNVSVSEIKKSMDSAAVLLEEAANGVTTPEQLDTIAYELRQTMKQLMSAANNSFNGDYIFGGASFSEPPYKEGIAVDSTVGGITAQGNPSKTIGYAVRAVSVECDWTFTCGAAPVSRCQGAGLEKAARYAGGLFLFWGNAADCTADPIGIISDFDWRTV